MDKVLFCRTLVVVLELLCSIKLFFRGNTRHQESTLNNGSPQPLQLEINE